MSSNFEVYLLFVVTKRANLRTKFGLMKSIIYYISILCVVFTVYSCQKKSDENERGAVFRYNESSNIQTVFKGTQNQPSVEKSHLGTVYKVEDATASSVNVDAPVYYKNVQIGKVSKIDLSEDGSKVIVDCLIFDMVLYELYVYFRY